MKAAVWSESKYIILSLLLGACIKAVLIDYLGISMLAPAMSAAAHFCITVFMRLMKFLSLPILFFAILATMSQFASLEEVKRKLGTVLTWTLLTTFIAALVAAILFYVINPVVVHSAHHTTTTSHMDALKAVIPDNIITMFSEQNVIAVVLFGLLLGAVTLWLPDDVKGTVSRTYRAFNMVFMTMARGLIFCLPFVLWAFAYQWVDQLDEHVSATMTLGWYALTIMLANTVQAFVVLPLILKSQQCSPSRLFKAMWPALNMAFFTKSSSATLPLSIECAVKRAKLPEKTIQYTMPLCATVNMNGCAAFIYITVMFVAQSYGVEFTLVEQIMWIFLSVVAAFGNAGVPMGCYFMSQAYLVMMDVPTSLMALILPFYAFLDMYETAINIWSDSCVSAICAQKDNMRETNG